MLEDRLPCPVYLDNGAKAMTLAESWFGAGRGVEDLVVILIGTGIGAGVIAEGKLYRGAANSAGEWGHSKIILDGRPCRCNSAGCPEAYAGAPGIVTTLRETRPDSPLLAQRDQFSFIESLSQAASRSDPAAQATLEATARYLGVGIANIVNLFNPHKILIGGWVGLQLGRQLLHGIETFVREHALPPAYRSVSIDLCHLGADAVPMGAACLVLETFLNAQSQG
jgi:predicted NBD/HSP70 family sugar kinase